MTLPQTYFTSSLSTPLPTVPSPNLFPPFPLTTKSPSDSSICPIRCYSSETVLLQLHSHSRPPLLRLVQGSRLRASHIVRRLVYPLSYISPCSPMLHDRSTLLCRNLDLLATNTRNCWSGSLKTSAALYAGNLDPLSTSTLYMISSARSSAAYSRISWCESRTYYHYEP